jgi:hypothetical protein
MSTTIAYNVEPANVNLVFTQNDTIDISFSVKKNNVALDMSGMALDMTIRDITVNNTLIRSLSTEGTSPEIIIITTTFAINTTGFDEVGKYRYDIQLTNGSEVFTIMKGYLTIVDEVTV